MDVRTKDIDLPRDLWEWRNSLMSCIEQMAKFQQAINEGQTLNLERAESVRAQAEDLIDKVAAHACDRHNFEAVMEAQKRLTLPLREGSVYWVRASLLDVVESLPRQETQEEAPRTS